MTATGYTGGDPTKLSKTGYTKGDVVAADASGTLQRIPIGSSAQVLTVNLAQPEDIDWEPGGGGGGGTPSGTVVSETAYGQAATAGVSNFFQRGDHTHGTPALPTSTQVGAVPTSRLITPGPVGRLDGGGDLSADRILTLQDYEMCLPSDFGYKAFTSRPTEPNSSTITGPVAGTVYFAKIKVPIAISVSIISMFVNSAGSVLTAGQCFAALFDGSKNLLATTADQSGVWNGGGMKDMAIAAQALAVGFCYVGWFFNGTTGPRFLSGTGSPVSGQTAPNGALAAAASLFGTADTGRTTTMPPTLGAFTGVGSSSLWVGLR